MLLGVIIYLEFIAVKAIDSSPFFGMDPYGFSFYYVKDGFGVIMNGGNRIIKQLSGASPEYGKLTKNFADCDGC